MDFVNPILFVEEIDRSKRFYCDVIGLTVKSDFGDFVLFEGGLAIHDRSSIERTMWGRERRKADRHADHAALMYFEDPDVDAAFDRIRPHVRIIHPVERQEWGQRVFRFHDPDGHLVEIGEPQVLKS